LTAIRPSKPPGCGSRREEALQAAGLSE